MITWKFKNKIVMTYNLKADNDVICQCGCIVNRYYMKKHLETAKHEREMVGRENIEVVEHYKYKPRLITQNIIKNQTKIFKYIFLLHDFMFVPQDFIFNHTLSYFTVRFQIFPFIILRFHIFTT